MGLCAFAACAQSEGTEWHEIERLGRLEDARIGESAGRELLALAGPNFLSSLTPRS